LSLAEAPQRTAPSLILYNIGAVVPEKCENVMPSRWLDVCFFSTARSSTGCRLDATAAHNPRFGDRQLMRCLLFARHAIYSVGNWCSSTMIPIGLLRSSEPMGCVLDDSAARFRRLLDKRSAGLGLRRKEARTAVGNARRQAYRFEFA
jgi:hypothetical protein